MQHFSFSFDPLSHPVQPTTIPPLKHSESEQSQKITQIAQSHMSSRSIHDFVSNCPKSPTTNAYLRPSPQLPMPTFHSPPPSMTQSAPLPHSFGSDLFFEPEHPPAIDPMPQLSFAPPPYSHFKPLSQSVPLSRSALRPQTRPTAEAFREPVGVRAHQPHPLPPQKNRPIYRRASRSPAFPLAGGATLGVLSGLFLGLSSLVPSLIIPGLLLSLFAIPLIGLGAIWCLLRRSTATQNQ